MKSLIFIFSITFLGFSAFSQGLEKLNTTVFDWNKSKVIKTKYGETRHFFEGNTNTLSSFEVNAISLNPGQAQNEITVPADMEDLIIVKKGKILHSINGDEEVLGPGSVILTSPGDTHEISNYGKSSATYYIFRWKAKKQIDMDRSQKAGGSQVYNWDEIKYKTTKKGGKRQFMRRSTAMFEELEMHVTTLSKGVISHGEHIHNSEEIILVIKGEVEESINGVKYQAGPGSLMLLINNDAHGIRNIGKGECEYFAFKWN